MTPNPRVHEVAADLGIESVVVIEHLLKLGHIVKGPSSSISPLIARQVSGAIKADRTDRRSDLTTRQTALVEPTLPSPSMAEASKSTYLSPKELLLSGWRILIDTNVFLENDDDRVGGLVALVAECADAIIETQHPLVVVAAVRKELEIKSRQPSPPDNARRAERAEMALMFIDELVADCLATTEFGAPADSYADDEFDGIIQTARSLGVSVCLVTNDNTRKITTRLQGGLGNVPQVAGRLRSDGQIELESDLDLLNWGTRKMIALQKAGFPDKYDKRHYDELSVLLPQLASLIPSSSPSPVTQFERQGLGAQVPVETLARDSSPKPFLLDEVQKSGDGELPPTTIPQSGSTVFGEGPSGRATYVLAEQIGRGKEGFVYAVVGDANKVIKIFPQKFRTRHRREKVGRLVDRELRSLGICFPEALISNEDDAFVGYLMRRASGGKVLSETITNRQLFKKTYPRWRKDDLVEVCLSFLERIQEMHSLNILVGDMNEGNLMVTPYKKVWIIDTDSCQFDGYVCPVGWPEFTAPELTRYDELRTEQHELFAVAMVLFMILMTGRFAYDRSDAPSLEDDDLTRFLIQEGKFPYKYRGQGDRDQPFGDAKYMWSHIDLGVKELFWETLHRDGRRYKARPTVEEWIAVFRTYKQNLANKGWDPMSHDVYPIRYKAFSRDVTIKDCPSCGWPNGVAGWPQENGSERVPAVCNRCAPKCVGCGDPDQFGTFRSGFCRVCREETSTPTTRLTTQSSPKQARPSVTTGTSTYPPHHGPSSGRATTHPPAPRLSIWDRFKKWFSVQ